MKFKIAGFCIALLMLLTASAFAQWQLQYQIQLGYSFTSVHFPTATVGYIVGSGGVIMKTTDGGSTWVQQASPTTAGLNDVFFTDALNGWAVGATGTMIYTNDGGTNWFAYASPTTVALYGVSFSGLNGVVGGGADNAASTIYYTVDGGANWTAAATVPSLDMCTDVSFSDATHVFASCDAGNGAKPIMFSVDGGVNWTLATTVNYGAYSYTRYDIEGIRAVSNTTIVATGWGSYVGAQPTVILVSTDGGVNFNAPDPMYSWKTYAYGYNIAKFDDGELVAVGGSTQTAGHTLHGIGPNYTTWTRYPAFYGEAIQDACALPGTNKIVAVGDAGFIAISNDRGATWTFSYDAGMPFQGLQDFVEMGPNKVWAAGAGGAMLYFDVAAGTHKYAMASPNNWGPTTIGDLDYVVNNKEAAPGMSDSSYNDVIYLSAATKYLCKSYDYGKTWYELSHTNALQDGILSMYWFSPDTGIVVGHKLAGTSSRDEVIWKTVDGGVTLTEVIAGTLPGTTALQWNGVEFAPANPAIGAVVGDDNYIFYTADGGVNWAQATENIATSTLDLEDLVFLSPTVALGVGDSGTLIKSTNSGATWTVQAVPWGTANLFDIAVEAPHRVWVSGADQLLYYSTDGGVNWTSAAVTVASATSDVKTVFFQGTAGILWAGCENSYVANRTDAVAGTDTPKSLPFVLNQNFPNPFNPSTTIEFTLASDDHVSLNVYDVSGKLVATIMSKDLSAGKYTVGFNADNLSSGVYFYKLSTSKFEETRKMVLLR